MSILLNTRHVKNKNRGFHLSERENNLSTLDEMNVSVDDGIQVQISLVSLPSMDIFPAQ